MNTRASGNPLPSGIFWGVIGIVTFSFTLPATRMALESFSPFFVTFGRAAGAGIAALLLLAVVRPRMPSRSDLLLIALVAAGVVFGFPLLMSLALLSIPVSDGGVVTGLIPILTALAAAFLGERPPTTFWCAVVLGLGSVIVFSILQSANGISIGYALLIAAAGAAAVGYAAGTVLAARMAPSHVICWALVVTLPVTIPVAFITAPATVGPITQTAAFGMVYVTSISMFLGFFAWYRGLAAGGLGRIGQLQLAQPLLTAFWSWMFLNERVEFATIAAGALVILSIWLALRSTVPPKPKARRSRIEALEGA